MKISDERTGLTYVSLKTLSPGQVFECGDEFWMKTDETDEEGCLCLCLNDGVITREDPTMEVAPVPVELVVK